MLNVSCKFFLLKVKMFLFIQVIILFICTRAAKSAFQNNNLIVVEDFSNDGFYYGNNYNDDNDDESSMPIKLFEATKEWKEVNNEILPKGLHVRINLETGKKEAKLLEDLNEIDVNSKITTKYQIATKNEEKNLKLNDVEDRFLRDINKLAKKNEPDEVKIRKNTADQSIKFEKEMLKSLLKKYNSSTDVNEKISILIDLEYLAHTIELGNDFYNFGGFDFLMKDLDQSNNQLIIEVLSVFGSAIQSNDYIKMELSKTTFLSKIINLIKINSNIDVRKKCFFVLSTLLRNSIPELLRFFTEFDGKNLLRHLFDIDLKLSVKIVAFYSDITNELSYPKDKKQSTAFEIIQSNYIDADICLKIIKRFNFNLNKYNLILLLESLNGLTTICRNEFISNRNLITEFEDKSPIYKEKIVQELLEKLFKKLNHSIKDEL